MSKRNAKVRLETSEVESEASDEKGGTNNLLAGNYFEGALNKVVAAVTDLLINWMGKNLTFSDNLMVSDNIEVSVASGNQTGTPQIPKHERPHGVGPGPPNPKDEHRMLDHSEVSAVNSNITLLAGLILH
ncbi:hypothetical protein PBY51_020390 [Eleginops maclovinus]|uniref:Uncharacterized protein n=1 Tax=Eleginops maclovinus TaxID=56733 RepID=A0AAN7XPY8_ELEMC|nr:hypothetical protein PBY51_020390 [Eleginops maclovinus]